MPTSFFLTTLLRLPFRRSATQHALKSNRLRPAAALSGPSSSLNSGSSGSKPVTKFRRTTANAWSNRSTLKTGDWLCVSCGFVSSYTQIRCGHCQSVRHAESFRVNQSPCNNCHTMNRHDREMCWHCEKKLEWKQIVRLRPADVRLQRFWVCSFCKTQNLLSKSVCKRCHKIRLD